ncbi:hypothetical protein CVT24_011167 [Panaeolus cyanescens]|uniref:Uncharacterized protein n=1 Tax=Panaeolus cyanescens TaxID=181874 RepID=A0A409YGE7_9AGAR|nr:hypothetical protein CVT24_011167 [Panaeolus cyanescens]
MKTKSHVGRHWIVCFHHFLPFSNKLALTPMSARKVRVDDTNPSIQYTGPWFVDGTGSQDNRGNFGPTYNKTLHGTIENASLSFTFSGTDITVWGTNNIRNDSGVVDPQWSCFIDNVPIRSNPFQFFENNWALCSPPDSLVLEDGVHVLTVNATVARSQTFWIDAIDYVPSASVPLDDKAILVENNDPQLQYGPGWQSLGGTANMTTVQGSSFTFQFYGVSLSWFGFIPRELPLGPAAGTYSIDDNTPVNFLLNGLPNRDSPTIYNQEFFRTSDYPAGLHKLTVNFLGSGQTTPLTLDYLVIRNGTVSTGNTNNNGTDTPGSSNTTDAHKSSSNVGAIVGGVLGGLAILVFAFLAFFYMRRRDRMLKAKNAPPQNITIIDTTRSPFDPPSPPPHGPSMSQLSRSTGDVAAQGGLNAGYQFPYQGSAPLSPNRRPSGDSPYTQSHRTNTSFSNTHSEMQSPLSNSTFTSSSGYNRPLTNNLSLHNPSPSGVVSPSNAFGIQTEIPAKLQREFNQRTLQALILLTLCKLGTLDQARSLWLYSVLRNAEIANYKHLANTEVELVEV